MAIFRKKYRFVYKGIYQSHFINESAWKERREKILLGNLLDAESTLVKL